MASMLDKMDPEVAKKAIEQFPEFSKTTKEMLKDYKELLDKGLVSNDESVTKVYDSYNAIITVLQKELENEELTFDQKKYIIEQMKYIAEKVDKKDTENKKFLAGLAMLASFTFGFAIVGFASVLGGNTQIESNDIDKIV